MLFTAGTNSSGVGTTGAPVSMSSGTDWRRAAEARPVAEDWHAKVALLSVSKALQY